MSNDRPSFFPRTLDRKILLQIVVFDGVRECDIGNFFVGPPVADLVEADIKCECRRNTADDRLLEFFGKASFEGEMKQEFVTGV